MKIHNLQLGYLQANCYVVETAPNRCIAVDIGGQPEEFMGFLKEKNLTLTKIFLTHGHFDHICGVEAVRSKTGAKVYIHDADSKMLVDADTALASGIIKSSFAPVGEFTAFFGDCFINDGECSFMILHTPGHTMGSSCFICEDSIFSGDTLFNGSVGRTDFPGSSPQLMRTSLKKLSELSGNYKVFPGHNEMTTLDYERECNPFIRRIRGNI